MRGAPAAVASATAIVGRAAQTRGYYIPHEERPDLIQEILVDVIREARTHDFQSDASFAAFVRVLAYRRCVDWVRRDRLAVRMSWNPSVLPAPDEPLLEKERLRLGVEVVAKLREGCRTLFALHAGRGLSYGEIGSLLGRTEGALRTQLYECLKAAQKILAHLRLRRQRMAG